MNWRRVVCRSEQVPSAAQDKDFAANRLGRIGEQSIFDPHLSYLRASFVAYVG
jgi:hypothetical protein